MKPAVDHAVYMIKDEGHNLAVACDYAAREHGVDYDELTARVETKTGRFSGTVEERAAKVVKQL